MGDRERSEDLRQELDRVASEIDGGLLAFASDEARHEWISVCSRLRPALSAAAIVSDDLVVVMQKVRRFSEILRTQKAGRATDGSKVNKDVSPGPAHAQGISRKTSESPRDVPRARSR
jgi:hypothetical protein